MLHPHKVESDEYNIPLIQSMLLLVMLMICISYLFRYRILSSPSLAGTFGRYPHKQTTSFQQIPYLICLLTCEIFSCIRMHSTQALKGDTVDCHVMHFHSPTEILPWMLRMPTIHFGFSNKLQSHKPFSNPHMNDGWHS